MKASSDSANDSAIAPENDFLLIRLLIGLDALAEKERKGDGYPYPPMLCAAWNELSLKFIETGKRPPASLSGLFALCQRPVGEWFPAKLPDDFPAGTNLLYGGGGVELTTSASEFLNEGLYRDGQIRAHADAASIERALQNAQFAAVLERLRVEAKNGYARAQRDYVLLRRFLIENPFTTTEQIRDAFAGTSVSPQEVGGMYVDCRPDETYRRCPNCGPLIRARGRWRGANPDICRDHLSDADEQTTPNEPGLRRLCAAIHRRVCLYGIEEVRLFDALYARRSDNPDALTDLEEWPGIDWCDVRVTFADGTAWAADMKDYRDPGQLTAALTAFAPAPESLPNPRFDRAFYVVPDRRERRNPGYCRRALSGANPPENYALMTVTAFLQELEIQITRCRAARRSAKRGKKEKNG